MPARLRPLRPYLHVLPFVFFVPFARSATRPGDAGAIEDSSYEQRIVQNTKLQGLYHKESMT